MEDWLAWMEWSAMAISLPEAWLIASKEPNKRVLAIIGNLMWISSAKALIALNNRVIALNLRGIPEKRKLVSWSSTSAYRQSTLSSAAFAPTRTSDRPEFSPIANVAFRPIADIQTGHRLVVASGATK